MHTFTLSSADALWLKGVREGALAVARTPWSDAAGRRTAQLGESQNYFVTMGIQNPDNSCTVPLRRGFILRYRYRQVHEPSYRYRYRDLRCYFFPSPPGESTDRPHLGFRTARRRRRRKNGTKIVGNSPLLLTTIRLPARAFVLPLPLRPSLDLPLPLRPYAILPLPPNPSWGVASMETLRKRAKRALDLSEGGNARTPTNNARRVRCRHTVSLQTASISTTPYSK